MDKNSFALLHRLRVRWNECDMHGIVFNVNYFLYYDIAMYEWQRAIGSPQDEQPNLVTAHAECDFKRSALFDEVLDVGFRCACIGKRSLNFEGAIFRGAELLNHGKLVYVNVDSATKASRPIGGGFIERILSFEKVEPASAVAPVRAALGTAAQS